MTKIITNMNGIKASYPRYKGEWPISHWCFIMDTLENYPRDAEVHVYDRHKDEPDFIVKNLGQQSDWFKAFAKRKKIRLDF